jgi:hypothetical protein
MPFHSGWSGPAKGFGYGGYYVGDNRYGHIGHQQDIGILRLENWMVWFPRKQQQLLVAGMRRSTEGCTLCQSTREQSREDRAEEQVFG